LSLNMKVSLSHDATLDLATKRIQVPIGDLILNIPIDEFVGLVEKLQDVAISLAAQTEIVSYVCESCGTINEVLEQKEDDA